MVVPRPKADVVLWSQPTKRSDWRVASVCDFDTGHSCSQPFSTFTSQPACLPTSTDYLLKFLSTSSKICLKYERKQYILNS